MDDPTHEPESPDLGEHPRGTLAIVAIFGIFFFAVWLIMYFVVFAGRGHTH